MDNDGLPSSVLYVKNGKGGKSGGEWWGTAKKNNQVHAGWREIPAEAIRKITPSTIDEEYDRYYPGGTSQDRNALRRLLDKPSQHLWVTVESGHLWWCTVRDGAEASDEENSSRGHFWLNCEKPWSKLSLAGKPLRVIDLPGNVTKVSGFRGTVGMPTEWQAILRAIRGEVDPEAEAAKSARHDYENAIKTLITRLHWKDFEQLVDLILIRSGWERISTVGDTQEAIDIAVENAVSKERAFVQVKSEANQAVFDDYWRRFNSQRETYARIIFAVHSPKTEIHNPDGKVVHIWTAAELAHLVVRLGLAERVEKMRG